MKEVEKKDLPGITGGQTGTTTNVGVATPLPLPPTYPGGGPTINDPTDPLGDAKQRPVQS
jgi:hypothetical protein